MLRFLVNDTLTVRHEVNVAVLYSTAATDTAPNTPTRPIPWASCLPKDALGSLPTPHMRGARMGSPWGS